MSFTIISKDITILEFLWSSGFNFEDSIGFASYLTGGKMGLGPPPTLVEYNNMRFVIADMPEAYSIHPYIQNLMQYNTHKLLRVCEGSYDTSLFAMVGIETDSLVYDDGTFPSPAIINDWISIVKQHFLNHPRGALAVHCRSGLGRSPVLVTIALMEAGMPPAEAVETIRHKRRGAFNYKQFNQLLNYKSQNRLCEKPPGLFPRLFCCNKRFAQTTFINAARPDHDFD